MTRLRFLHLADLHLMPCPYGGKCGPTQPACHRCIKAGLLERLAERIASDPPDLLLLAGDLTDVKGEGSRLRAAAAPLIRLIERAILAGVRVVGITGEHDGEDSTDNLRRVLGWNWLLHSGEMVEYKGVEIHGVEGRPNRAGLREDVMRVTPSSRPSVLLAHGELSAVRTKGAPRFDYCAFGHLHRAAITRLTAGGYAAYPGHLFSYWDGDGKAWPCRFIEGSIDERGDVQLTMMDSGAALGAPETRRLYVDFAARGNQDGSLAFENAPDEAFFAAHNLSAQIKVEPERSSGATPRRVAVLPYTSRVVLSDLLQIILKAHRSDVFVLPSDGGGWETRADTGGRFATLRFDEFSRRLFKMAPNTQ